MKKILIRPDTQPLKDPRQAHEFAYDEAHAWRSVCNGVATPEQQKKVRDLLYAMTQLRFQDVYPGNDAFSNFAGGKRHIGQQLAWLEFVDMEQFNKLTTPKKEK